MATGDAAKLIAQAEKALKTSVIALKFKPDYDTAIELYNKASLILLAQEKYEETAKMHEKIAEAHLALGSDFHSAKNLAKAASFMLKVPNVKKAINLYERAGLLYRSTGKTDMAATMYKEAADNVHAQDPFKAGELLSHAAQTAAGDGKFHEASVHAQRSASMFAKCPDTDQAESLLRETINFTIHSNRNQSDGMASTAQMCAKSVIPLIILKLVAGDVIAARKIQVEAIDKWGFKSTDSNHVVERLLNAIEVEDGLEARLALDTATFKQIDMNFALLTKKIELPALKQRTIPTGGASSTAQADDDECDDIC